MNSLYSTAAIETEQKRAKLNRTVWCFLFFAFTLAKEANGKVQGSRYTIQYKAIHLPLPLAIECCVDVNVNRIKKLGLIKTNSRLKAFIHVYMHTYVLYALIKTNNKKKKQQHSKGKNKSKISINFNNPHIHTLLGITFILIDTHKWKK